MRDKDFVLILFLKHNLVDWLCLTTTMLAGILVGRSQSRILLGDRHIIRIPCILRVAAPLVFQNTLPGSSGSVYCSFPNRTRAKFLLVHGSVSSGGLSEVSEFLQHDVEVVVFPDMGLN